MKIASAIAGILLGALFLLASIPFLFHLMGEQNFVAKSSLLDPMVIAIVVLAAFLLVSGRKAFAGLLR